MPLTDIGMLTFAVMHTVHNSLEVVVKFPKIFFPTNSKFLMQYFLPQIKHIVMTVMKTTVSVTHKHSLRCKLLRIEIQHDTI